MAYLFNGTTAKLTLASAVVTAPPLTMACFFKPAAIGSFLRMIDAGEITGANVFLVALAASGVVQAFTTAVSSANASTTETAVLNTWQSAAMVSQSAASRYATYNGRLSAVNGTSKIPSGVNQLNIGVSSSGALQFWSGLLAEIAVWQVALTPRELQSFHEGKPANLIRPEALKLYMPLTTQAGIQDFGPQSLIFANTACVPVADHPTILRPVGVKPWQ